MNVFHPPSIPFLASKCNNSLLVSPPSPHPHHSPVFIYMYEIESVYRMSMPLCMLYGTATSFWSGENLFANGFQCKIAKCFIKSRWKSGKYLSADLEKLMRKRTNTRRRRPEHLLCECIIWMKWEKWTPHWLSIETISIRSICLQCKIDFVIIYHGFITNSGVC